MQGASVIYLVSNTALKPKLVAANESAKFKFLPDHVYCLLPSVSSDTGSWRMYPTMPNFVKNLPFWLFLGKVNDHSNFGMPEDNYEHVNLQESEPENVKKFWMGQQVEVKNPQYCFSERVNQGGAQQSDGKKALQDGAKEIQQESNKRAKICGGKSILEGGRFGKVLP